jgi:hypothetical protein
VSTDGWTDGRIWWNQYTPLQLHCGGYNYWSSNTNPTKNRDWTQVEERRIPFIFDDFHFCRSRVNGLDMTENRIFTLCHMITWVVFLRMLEQTQQLPKEKVQTMIHKTWHIKLVLLWAQLTKDIPPAPHICPTYFHNQNTNSFFVIEWTLIHIFLLFYQYF